VGIIKKGRIHAHEPPNAIVAILAALSLSLALADDFKTINGKEYKNVTVSRQEPDGIIVTNAKAGLMVKLYFTTAEITKASDLKLGWRFALQPLSDF
jgi:hypothetical protein